MSFETLQSYSIFRPDVFFFEFLCSLRHVGIYASWHIFQHGEVNKEIPKKRLTEKF